MPPDKSIELAHGFWADGLSPVAMLSQPEAVLLNVIREAAEKS
jgi:hypothetical protein